MALGLIISASPHRYCTSPLATCQKVHSPLPSASSPQCDPSFPLNRTAIHYQAPQLKKRNTLKTAPPRTSAFSAHSRTPYILHQSQPTSQLPHRYTRPQLSKHRGRISAASAAGSASAGEAWLGGTDKTESEAETGSPVSSSSSSEDSRGSIGAVDVGTTPVNPLLSDIQRKLPHYASDFSDGLHPQALAAVAFLAFACLTPCIAFGSLTAAQTGGAIGVVETVLGTAVSGVLYALLSGQPLTLLGPTGLVVVFTGLLFKTCNSLGLPFLPVYGWVSVWSAAFLLGLALSGASDLIHHFTRFTDDTFSVLISLGFISEACKNLVKEFSVSTVSNTISGHANISTPLLSAVVAIGTWLLASFLSGLRNTALLVKPLRTFLSDFGPPIAIAAMTLFPRILFPSVPLPSLAPPLPPEAATSAASLASAFATSTGRPWIVPLGSLPPLAILACSVPAALLTLLIFLDQNITTRLLDAPENNLRKGCAYHLDMAVLAGLMLLSALFGTPWMVASTVPSLAHVKSLALSPPSPPSPTTNGAMQPNNTSPGGTRENRITGLAIHVAVGTAALLLPLLALVPSAVSQGLFVFMGLSGLANNQLVERFKLWVCDPEQYPDLPFVKGIRIQSVHAFTAVQVACLGALWQLKHSKWGIFFPLLILALMPIRRFLAPLWFSEGELRVLDSH